MSEQPVCPGCSRFIYDMDTHMTCVLDVVATLRREVDILIRENRMLRRAINEDKTEG